MNDVIKKSRDYLRVGAVPLAKKAVNKLCHADFIRYRMYIHSRKDSATPAGDAEDLPLVSVVVPLYRTRPALLRELISSVVSGDYDRWELCLCDGSESAEHSRAIRSVIREFPGAAIRYGCLKKNLGIAGNTNKAISMAKGDWIVFADHDDTFSKNALSLVAAAIINNPTAELIYSDEDKIHEHGGMRYDPHFKPDFDPFLLDSVNYISHLSAVKRELVVKLGGLDSRYDGAQDYDFILRATEKAENIVHIPEVLYHWRSCSGSTAKELSEKEYAGSAGQRALEVHLKRCLYEAEALPGELAGSYRLRFPSSLNSLSVIMWSEKKQADIEAAADKLRNRLGSCVTVYTCEFADILKTARQAESEIILFLRSDAYISKEDTELLEGYVESGYTDACGVTLTDERGVIICSGQIKGENGYPFDAFNGLAVNDPGYMGRAMMMRGVSFLPIHCLMIRRKLIPDFKRLCTPELLGAKLCRNLAHLGKKIACASFIHVTLRHKGPLCSMYRMKEVSIKGSEDRYYHEAFIKKSPGFVITSGKKKRA